MSKSVKRNYIYNLCYQILTILTPLITAPYLSRVLGPQCIGELSYVESIVSYFTLFAALGISIYGAREISYVQDDKEKRSEIFWNAKSLTFITTVICLFLYFIFLVLTKHSGSPLFVYSYVLVVNVFFDISWFFQGMEEFGKIVIRDIIIKVLTITFIFVFVHSTNDFYIYVIILFGFNILSSLSLWPMLKGYVCRPKKIRPFANVKTILSLFVPTIAISIYTVLDKTMIGLFSINSLENGYYEQALKLSKMVLTIVTSLGIVMVPRIGVYVGKEDFKTVKELISKSYRFVFFLGIPLYLGLFAVSANLVPWFFGNGYDKVIILLRILGLLIIAIGLSNVTGIQYLIPTKRQNVFTMTVVIGAVVNFICNLILIPRYFSIGAAIASVIAETVITCIQLIIIRKELPLVDIFKQCWKYLIGGIVMFVTLCFIERLLEPKFLNTLLLFIIGILSYFLSLLILRDDFLLENMYSLRNNLLRKNKKNVE